VSISLWFVCQAKKEVGQLKSLWEQQPKNEEETQQLLEVVFKKRGWFSLANHNEEDVSSLTPDHCVDWENPWEVDMVVPSDINGPLHTLGFELKYIEGGYIRPAELLKMASQVYKYRDSSFGNIDSPTSEIFNWTLACYFTTGPTSQVHNQRKYCADMIRAMGLGFLDLTQDKLMIHHESGNGAFKIPIWNFRNTGWYQTHDWVVEYDRTDWLTLRDRIFQKQKRFRSLTKYDFADHGQKGVRLI